MSKVVSQDTKCSILKCYENMKRDRPDLSYDHLVTKLTPNRYFERKRN
jgi:hypothetical protein